MWNFLTGQSDKEKSEKDEEKSKKDKKKSKKDKDKSGKGDTKDDKKSSKKSKKREKIETTTEKVEWTEIETTTEKFEDDFDELIGDVLEESEVSREQQEEVTYAYVAKEGAVESSKLKAGAMMVLCPCCERIWAVEETALKKKKYVTCPCYEEETKKMERMKQKTTGGKAETVKETRFEEEEEDETKTEKGKDKYLTKLEEKEFVKDEMDDMIANIVTAEKIIVKRSCFAMRESEKKEAEALGSKESVVQKKVSPPSSPEPPTSTESVIPKKVPSPEPPTSTESVIPKKVPSPEPPSSTESVIPKKVPSPEPVASTESVLHKKVSPPSPPDEGRPPHPEESKAVDKPDRPLVMKFDPKKSRRHLPGH